jgi:hypothetical protein
MHDVQLSPEAVRLVSPEPLPTNEDALTLPALTLPSIVWLPSSVFVAVGHHHPRLADGLDQRSRTGRQYRHVRVVLCRNRIGANAEDFSVRDRQRRGTTRQGLRSEYGRPFGKCYGAGGRSL